MPPNPNLAHAGWWTLGVIVWALVARIGWELGGRLWALF